MLTWLKIYKYPLLSLGIWLVFECSISWFATCQQVNYGEPYDSSHQNNCTIAAGPLVSSTRFGISASADFLKRREHELIAGFTIVLGFSTVLLWIVTKKAAEAARAAAEHIPKIERAYVYIEPKWDFRSSNTVRFEYTFHNHGKTPAVIKSLDVRSGVFSTPPDNTIHDPNQTINDEYVLPASDHWGPMHEFCTYVEDDRPALVGREKFMWFYGSLKYEDVFGIERVTRFRWKIKDWVKSRFHADGRNPYNERT